MLFEERFNEIPKPVLFVIELLFDLRSTFTKGIVMGISNMF